MASRGGGSKLKIPLRRFVPDPYTYRDSSTSAQRSRSLGIENLDIARTYGHTDTRTHGRTDAGMDGHFGRLLSNLEGDD